MSGALQIILHAHLPFVRHPENAYHLEENWLFEAITETYLPLLAALDSLAADGVPGALTLTFSAPLVAMLDDPLLRTRYTASLDRTLALADEEVTRTAAEDPRLHATAQWYRARLGAQRAQWDAIQHDVLGAYVRHANTGRIELGGCAGTHGLLPLMRHRGSQWAQINTAAQAFHTRTGFPARGMWMPECAYVPGIEPHLARAGIHWTVVDAHGLKHATSEPVRGLFAPIVAPSGTCFFARDPESSEQVWSSHRGYPGDPRYRDFYRDVGFDRPAELIAPYIHPDGIRVHTGLKFWAVTSRTDDHKNPWDPVEAQRVARGHARDFVDKRIQQLRWAADRMDVPPVVTCPYDAELFGHWWFEGPWFLEAVLREAARTGLQTTTPSAWLRIHRVHQEALPAASSWGENGFWEVWNHPRNADMVRDLYVAEEQTRAALLATVGADATVAPVRAQLCRELLLAQSSDWAFIVYGETSVEYARSRHAEHCAAVTRLVAMLQGTAPVDLAWVADRAGPSPLFPDLQPDDWLDD